VFHWDAITAFGAICGAMTSTPGLGAVVRLSRSQASSLAYVAVYPTALIGITIFAPLLGLLLARLMNLVS
jgi:putative transport protein